MLLMPSEKPLPLNMPRFCAQNTPASIVPSMPPIPCTGNTSRLSSILKVFLTAWVDEVTHDTCAETDHDGTGRTPPNRKPV